ncbi:cupin domain-containing protein [Geosporobacter ferrireducens]|uniref:Cupin n=1 Tax=Geosporobacter ferrireducens TaxID=1424294 RepID=A0A1D8GKX5_9FIRM|nr:cupin domain-containing protein [Geosporobacter ferrireducens]AOT71567.1 cupin [Geosporobacter ferrireducens]MTI57880.1 cupin domain-containing protein [Geosporobacter ferrireducens]
MFHLHESELEYRFGDSGPKYLLKGPRANMGVVVLKPGQDFNNHYHNVMEENFFILEGEIEFTINGKKILCKKGDFVHVEPQETHYLKNLSDTIAKAVFCLAPYQESDKVEVSLV